LKDSQTQVIKKTTKKTTTDKCLEMHRLNNVLRW